MKRYHLIALSWLILAFPTSAWGEGGIYDFLRESATLKFNAVTTSVIQNTNPEYLLQPSSYVTQSMVTASPPAPALSPLVDRSTRFQNLLLGYVGNPNSVLGCMANEGEGLAEGETTSAAQRTFVAEAVRIFNQANFFSRSVELSQSIVEPSYASQELVRNAAKESLDFIRPQFRDLIAQHPCLDGESVLQAMMMGATFILPSI